jgi:4-hydroxy-tetrahydrodipicolinate reductase
MNQAKRETTATAIVIVGAGGRMGRMLVRVASETPGARVAAGLDRVGAADLDRDLGELAGIGGLGLRLTDDIDAAFAAGKVAIDFTQPDATAANAERAAERGIAYVIGTTGLTPAHLARIGGAAERTPIVLAPNMSLGVTLLASLVEEVARRLDPSFDIEVVEMHHRMKVDAPSGTALALGRAAAKGRGRPLEELWVKARDGITGPRQPGTIGFATLRGGDVIGDHSVIFAAQGERLELTHKASSRELFARGALRAALWVKDKPPRLYSMQDVLGL